MKKIVRLTESDLVRLVKRVINEQENAHHTIYKDLKDRYIPYGFREEDYTKMNAGLLLMKGDDNNGVSITSNGVDIGWAVTIDGKTKLFKEAKLDGNNNAKIFNDIIKDIDPYKNYQFKKTPYQG